MKYAFYRNHNSNCAHSMMKDFDKAQIFLGSFEKKSTKYAGVDDLSDALYILSAILKSEKEHQLKAKVNNLISTNRAFILPQMHRLLDTPGKHTYQEFDYWCRVLQEYFDYGFANDDLLFIEQELLKHREQSRWDSLSEKEKTQELISKIEQLSKVQRAKIAEFIQEALDTKKIK